MHYPALIPLRFFYTYLKNGSEQYFKVRSILESTDRNQKSSRPTARLSPLRSRFLNQFGSYTFSKTPLLSRETLLQEKGYLLELAQTIAPVKDAEVVGAHLLKQGVINAVHHPGGQQRLIILGGKKLRGLGVKFFATIRLVIHKRDKAAIIHSPDEITLGVLEAAQVMKRHVDARAV